MSQGPITSDTLVTASPRRAVAAVWSLFWVGGVTVIAGAIALGAVARGSAWAWGAGAAAVLATTAGTFWRRRRRADGRAGNSETTPTGRRLLDAVFDAASAIVLLTDVDDRVLRISPACAERLGVEADRAVGETMQTLLPQPLAARYREITRRVLKSGEAAPFEECLQGACLEGSVHPVRDDDGRIAQLLLFARDITQRRRAEKQLRESELRYRTLFEQAADSIILINPDTGGILHFNDSACRNLGYARHEFRRLRLADLAAGADIAGHIKRLRRHGRDQFTTTLRTKTGGRRNVQATSRIVTINGEPRVYSLIRDITCEVRAEAALQDKERRYRSLFDHSPVATLETDMSRLQRDIARLTEAGVGDLGEYLAARPEMGRAMVTGLHVLRVNKAALDLFEVGDPGEFRRNLWSLFTDDMAAALLEAACGFAAGRMKFDSERTNHTRPGRALHTMVRLSLAPGNKPPWSRVLISLVDITERKRLERDILRIGDLERLRVGQDLHDGLGQILTGAACMCTALKNRLADQDRPEAEQAAEIARLITQSAREARTLARGLNPVGRRPDSLRASMSELAANVEKMFGASCRFIASEPAPALDHKTSIHLYRIAQEAVSNAARHGRARNVEIRLNAEPSAVAMTITDDGAGLPCDFAERSGLGVHTMQRRAASMGGVLCMRPRQKGGTVVSCRVPIALEAPAGEGRSR